MKRDLRREVRGLLLGLAFGIYVYSPLIAGELSPEQVPDHYLRLHGALFPWWAPPGSDPHWLSFVPAWVIVLTPYAMWRIWKHIGHGFEEARSISL